MGVPDSKDRRPVGIFGTLTGSSRGAQGWWVKDSCRKPKSLYFDEDQSLARASHDTLIFHGSGYWGGGAEGGKIYIRWSRLRHFQVYARRRAVVDAHITGSVRCVFQYFVGTVVTKARAITLIRS